MADRRILITGVSGFVGRHLAAVLARLGDAGVYGTILSPQEVTEANPLPGVELIECRLEDPARIADAVRQAQPSVVYHLAAQSSVPRSLTDPEGTFQANVMGTLHLLQALRQAEGLQRVVLIGSAEVYGALPESMLPANENALMDPSNPYACSKACADMLGAQYFRTFHLPVIRVRPFNHIGPGQSPAFAASAFARQIAEVEAGIRPPRIMVGNLDARRDFTDVRDVVRAYVLAAERCTPGEVYNICSGKAISMREVLDGLIALSSTGMEVAQDPDRMRPSDIPVTLGDCSRFKSATGWSPQIPMDTTLKDLLDYWREQVFS